MPKFFSNINLKRNELQFPIVHQSSGTPTNSATEFSLKGQLYFDTGYTGGTGIPLFICTTSGTSESSSGTWKVVDWTHNPNVKTGIKVTASNGSTPAYIDNDFSSNSLVALGANPAADDLMIIQEDTGSAFKAVKMSELAGYVNGLQSIISLSGDTQNGVATMSGTSGQLDVESTLLFDGAAGLSIGGSGNSTNATITRVARDTGNTAAGAFTITGQNQFGGGASVDKTGGTVNIYGGRGTGTGDGGSVVLKTAAPAESSGNGLNTLSNTWTFASSGTTTFPGAISPASAQNLILSSTEDIHFKIDTDADSTSQFEWYAGATEIAKLDESGNLQIDGTLTVDGSTITFDSVGITGIETASESGSWADDDVTLATTAGIKTYIDAQNFSTADGNTNNGLTSLSITPSVGSASTILHNNGGAGFIAGASNAVHDENDELITGLTVKFEQADLTGGGAAAANTGIVLLAGSGLFSGQSVTVQAPSGGTNLAASIGVIAPVVTADLASPGTGILTMEGASNDADVEVIGVIGDTPDTIQIGLKNTGVAAAQYGSTSSVPQITVDAKGRITAASNVSVTSANDNTITLAGGTALDLDTSGSNGNGSFTLNQNSDEIIALKHSDIAYTATDDGTGDATLNFGDTFDVLNGITVNGQGHTTGSNKATFTMPTPSTVGGALFSLSDPSAIRFIKIAADNSVEALDAANFRTAIGAGTSSTVGTVTGTGTANKIAKFSSGSAIGDSSITDNGTTVEVDGALTVSGNAAITGNLSVADLTVNGTTTTVNSTVVNVTDPIFTLGNYNVAGDSKDRGIEFFHGADTNNNFNYTVYANQTVEIFIDAHGYEVGNLVTLSGSGLITGLAGDYVISEIVDADSFRFAGPGGLAVGANLSTNNVTSVVSGKGFFGLDASATRFTALRNAVNTSEVFSGTPMDVSFGAGAFTGAVTSNGTTLTGATNTFATVTDNNSGTDTASSSTDSLAFIGGGQTTTAVTANTVTISSTHRAIHDSPSDSATTTSISSNWAYDHNAGTGNSAHVPSQGTDGEYLAHDGAFAQVAYTQVSGTPDLSSYSTQTLTIRSNVSTIDVSDSNFVGSGDATITHSWSTQSIIVQCYVSGELIHADVTLADATVALHFDKIPASNVTVVMLEAAGATHTTTAPSYG